MTGERSCLLGFPSRHCLQVRVSSVDQRPVPPFWAPWILTGKDFSFPVLYCRPLRHSKQQFKLGRVYWPSSHWEFNKKINTTGSCLTSRCEAELAQLSVKTGNSFLSSVWGGPPPTNSLIPIMNPIRLICLIRAKCKKIGYFFELCIETKMLEIAQEAVVSFGLNRTSLKTGNRPSETMTDTCCTAAFLNRIMAF